MKVLCVAVVLIVASTTGGALAQQAPHVCAAGPGANEVMAGIQPGGPGVAPTPLCYWRQGAEQGDAGPQVLWADRWGAIASDNDAKNAIFGIVTDRPSERAARRAAVDECRSRGGDRCEVAMSYQNQCAAVGAGRVGTFSAGAPTLEEAQQRAMQLCEIKNGSGECWLYYSGCSLPVRVQ